LPFRFDENWKARYSNQGKKDRVIIIVDKKSLTWKQMIEELKKDDDFSKKVEEAFEELLK